MRWETKANYSMCLCKKYLSKHGNREKSYINIDSFWWNKNFKRSVCTVAGYFYGNIGKLIKTHSHNFRKVQTRQLRSSQLHHGDIYSHIPGIGTWNLEWRHGKSTWQRHWIPNIVEMVSSAAPRVEGHCGAAVRLAIAKFCCSTCRELRSCRDEREPSQHLRHQLLGCERGFMVTQNGNHSQTHFSLHTHFYCHPCSSCILPAPKG